MMHAPLFGGLSFTPQKCNFRANETRWLSARRSGGLCKGNTILADGMQNLQGPGRSRSSERHRPGRWMGEKSIDYEVSPLGLGSTRVSGGGTGDLVFLAKTSSQFTSAVTFINTASVTTEPMATVNPVIPSKKKL